MIKGHGAIKRGPGTAAKTIILQIMRENHGKGTEKGGLYKPDEGVMSHGGKYGGSCWLRRGTRLTGTVSKIGRNCPAAGRYHF